MRGTRLRTRVCKPAPQKQPLCMLCFNSGWVRMYACIASTWRTSTGVHTCMHDACAMCHKFRVCTYTMPVLRLRTSVYAAPPLSMERHSRRAEVLHFALATMRGTSASGVPGVLASVHMCACMSCVCVCVRRGGV